MGPLVSRLGAFWFSSSHNTDNLCSIFKNKVLNSKLKLFYQTKQFVHISGFKIEQHLYKVAYFFWDTKYVVHIIKGSRCTKLGQNFLSLPMRTAGILVVFIMKMKISSVSKS